MRVVCDIETDALDATKIWCIVCLDIDTNKIYTFKEGECYGLFVDFAHGVNSWIFHNGLSFDVPTLNRLTEVNIDYHTVTDTLVLSKLFYPNRPGGHSLESWGERFGNQKIDFKDFSKFSTEMLEYCIQDVKLGYQLYKYLMSHEKPGFSDTCIKVEHSVRWLMTQQEKRGFYIDLRKAHELFLTTGKRMQEIETEVRKVFKPRSKPIGEPRTPRIIKVREWTGEYTTNEKGRKVKLFREVDKVSKVGLSAFGEKYEDVEGPFSLFFIEDFNLGSVVQIKERLFELGWQPTVFKKPTENQLKAGLEAGIPKNKIKGSPVVSEDTMADFADKSGLKEAILLAEYLMVKSRNATVQQWLDLVDDNSRIHGRVDTLGADTHRFTHSSPNTANIPAVVDKHGRKAPYGYECRDCWTVEDKVNRCILGVDASGIQLRALAHYMNDKEYIRQIQEGDIHTYNQGLFGVSDRRQAKTLIYALLLGAGDAKLGSVIGGGLKEGRVIRETFYSRCPAFKRFKDSHEADARRGYIIGLDGRRFKLDSAYDAMKYYLQGFEAVVMKVAMLYYHKEFEKRKLDVWQVAHVHDEAQFDALRNHAEEAGEIVVESISRAGQVLKSNCPLTGEWRVADSWAGSH